jgi:hypothetical protein
LHATAKEQYETGGIHIVSTDEKPGIQALERDGIRATASKDVDDRDRGEKGYEKISERKCVEQKRFRRPLCEIGKEQVE